MDKRKKEEKNDWTPVPQFGGWDHKGGGGVKATDYSMVFSQARANRKQHKTEVGPRHSVGNEKELIIAKHEIQREDEPVKKQHKIIHYLTCCFRP